MGAFPQCPSHKRSTIEYGVIGWPSGFVEAAWKHAVVGHVRTVSGGTGWFPKEETILILAIRHQLEAG
jgi:hypothetical protein